MKLPRAPAGAPAGLPDALSGREAQILRLVARGLSNREIGAELYISEHTAANHVRSILRKTGCANRTEAASYAHRHGLADAIGTGSTIDWTCRMFVIERRFAEQLQLSDDDVKLIEEVNADEGVRWLFSFLSADRRRTYCLYEAPSADGDHGSREAGQHSSRRGGRGRARRGRSARSPARVGAVAVGLAP